MLAGILLAPHLPLLLPPETDGHVGESQNGHAVITCLFVVYLFGREEENEELVAVKTILEYLW